MRGYRPSQYPDCVEQEDTSFLEAARAARIPAYAQRAEGGLPLFDDLPSLRGTGLDRPILHAEG